MRRLLELLEADEPCSEPTGTPEDDHECFIEMFQKSLEDMANGGAPVYFVIVAEVNGEVYRVSGSPLKLAEWLESKSSYADARVGILAAVPSKKFAASLADSVEDS